MTCFIVCSSFSPIFLLLPVDVTPLASHCPPSSMRLPFFKSFPGYFDRNLYFASSPFYLIVVTMSSAIGSLLRCTSCWDKHIFLGKFSPVLILNLT
ncbi:hypothetical protein BKA69DRAFT_912590 [Paraphysoderma sedebokerense]|nr:hypothetical protein BKA69DRAFT_912590 [Paraphysoderma sedebokerense]